LSIRATDLRACADSEEIAEKALAEIEVEYEPLPNVLSVEEALRDDSFPLHPDVRGRRVTTVQVEERVVLHPSPQRQRQEGLRGRGFHS